MSYEAPPAAWEHLRIPQDGLEGIARIVLLSPTMTQSQISSRKWMNVEYQTKVWTHFCLVPNVIKSKTYSYHPHKQNM